MLILPRQLDFPKSVIVMINFVSKNAVITKQLKRLLEGHKSFYQGQVYYEQITLINKFMTKNVNLFSNDEALFFINGK